MIFLHQTIDAAAQTTTGEQKHIIENNFGKQP